MLKRRDAFLKKSALAVSMALLLSAQAQAQAQAILIGPIQPGEHSSFLVGDSVAGRSSGDIRNVWLVGDNSFLLDSNGSVLLGNNSGVVSSPGSVSLGHDALIADSEWGTVAGCVFRSIRSRIGIEVRSAIRIHSINRELNFFYRFLTRFFAAFHYRGIFPQ